MTELSSSWSIAALFWALYMLTHLLVSRFRPPSDLYRLPRRLFLLFVPLAMLAAGLLFEGQAPPNLSGPFGTPGERATAVAVFLFLYLLFMSFYATVSHSVRVRLSVELRKAEPAGLPMDALLKIYDTTASMTRRVQSLEENGFIERVQVGNREGYRLRTKGKIVAQLARIVQSLYGVYRGNQA